MEQNGIKEEEFLLLHSILIFFKNFLKFLSKSHLKIILNSKLKFVSREESSQLIKTLNLETCNEQGTSIHSIISKTTLNTISETAMGVKLESVHEPDEYRQQIYQIGNMLQYRALRPWLHSDLLYKLLGFQKTLNKFLKTVHLFTNNIISQRRKFYEKNQLNDNSENM